MGRTKSQEWEHVIQVKALGKGQFTCQCKYCSHKFDGCPSRIRAHILGGVSPCGKVPNNVKEAFKKSIGHANVGTSNVPNVDDIVDDVEIDHASNDTQNVHGHVDLEESGQASKNVHPSSFKKRKLSQQGLYIPFWKVRSPYFKDMVAAIGHAGPSFVAPSFYALRKTELNDEIQVIANDLNVIKEKWRKYGCTIEIIIEVGPENVVQVCMHNASNCVRAGEMVENEWPHIFFTRCACHCLDLLFEDIGKLEWVAKIIESACKIVKFVTRKEKVLALFRSLSSRDLIKPAPTRFAYYYIMLENLLDDRCLQGLRKLLVDDKFLKLKCSSSALCTEVYDIVFSNAFWHDAKLIVKLCAPILKILRLCDREGATMGLIYELTDLGFMLHPIWKHKNQESDVEVHEGWIKFLEKYCHQNVQLMGDLMEDYDMYKNDYGSFASPVVHDPRRMQEGVKLWEMFGGCTPKLKSLAIRVLSQGSCASPCERNWSTYSLIHTKRRNRLLPSNANKLVYIHTNLRLLSKVKERGFERMEITLDMLNKEKDEDRLLALQNMREAEIGPLDDASNDATNFDAHSLMEGTPSSNIGTSSSVHNYDPFLEDDNVIDDDDEEEDDEEDEYADSLES
ncbi:hypothetical protein KP509_23G027600 [Ceratopteris richardii]|uniref:Uncharacterized protein n=1 Tax=Ceratopteris richardii TaxID=49495 RepID=A0A8T2S0J8_CERRI|nr:hypothetical protein KP509_23G027600 [Ceratopteris richardii]